MIMGQQHHDVFWGPWRPKSQAAARRLADAAREDGAATLARASSDHRSTVARQTAEHTLELQAAAAAQAQARAACEQELAALGAESQAREDALVAEFNQQVERMSGEQVTLTLTLTLPLTLPYP
jgi:hypothetical protein